MTMPGPRPAKLCPCLAKRCYADAFQIPAIPWPSFSFLRSALPPRFGTMPVRNTAMPWLHISLLAPPCSVLCPGYAAHIRRRSIQSLHSALPVYASAGQISSQPYHSAALPSYALPMPGQAVHNLCHAILFHATAAHRRSTPPPVAALPPQIHALPKQLSSVHCRACTTQCLARTCPCSARADLLITFPKRDFSMHCLCNSSAELNATVPLPVQSPHCHRHSMHCLCCSDHYCASTIPYHSLPTQIFSLPRLYESLLRLACTHHCHALRYHRLAYPCQCKSALSLCVS